MLVSSSGTTSLRTLSSWWRPSDRTAGFRSGFLRIPKATQHGCDQIRLQRCSSPRMRLSKGYSGSVITFFSPQAIPSHQQEYCRSCDKERELPRILKSPREAVELPQDGGYLTLLDVGDKPSFLDKDQPTPTQKPNYLFSFRLQLSSAFCDKAATAFFRHWAILD